MFGVVVSVLYVLSVYSQFSLTFVSSVNLTNSESRVGALASEQVVSSITDY